MYKISLGFISDMLNIILKMNTTYIVGEKNYETGSKIRKFLICKKCSKTTNGDKFNFCIISNQNRS